MNRITPKFDQTSRYWRSNTQALDVLTHEYDDVLTAMLNYIALALLLAGQHPHLYPTPALTPTLEDYEFHRGVKIECQEPLPEGFACGVILSIDPPLPDGIASIVGGEDRLIRGIGVAIDGTLYTVAFDSSLKRGDHSSDIKRCNTVPARVERNNLIVQWPDGTQSKVRIIHRDVAEPTRPQPA